MLEAAKFCQLCFVIFLWGFVWAVNGQNSFSTDIGDKKFYISLAKKTNWFKASQSCGLLGMSLASIETEKEFTGLKNYLLSKNNLDAGFWLSGSNLADTSNAEYTWYSNGNRISYTQYANSHPDTSTAGSCIFTNAKFLWETQLCVPAAATANKYFICSRPLVPNCGITGRCKRNAGF